MKLYLAFAAVLAIAVIVAYVIGRKHARFLQRSRRIHIERFKLKSRHTAITAQVLASADVQEAIRVHASEHQKTLAEAEETARTYLREILPKFNLLAYYRFGHPIARAILNFLFRVVVERRTIRDFGEMAPKGSVVVYIINHRSNVDYVLVAHMLFKFISLSYAVGEWARVWPLNHLFKWFGAYFIRRRFREPLYHAVLATFVQTITRNGVTQGIFIEGGLTRDGAFQKPKLGMLDYIVSSKRDAQFDAPLYIIPTAINYDRVLEDRNLTEELIGREDRRTRWEKFHSTIDFLFKNTLRSIIGRFKRYGYAVVSFGEPILVDDFVRAHPEILARDFEKRKGALTRLAEEVMHRISNSLPITPVTLLAAVFREHPSASLSQQEILVEIERLRLKWRDRLWLLREHTADELWKAARQVLELRRLIVLTSTGWKWDEAETLLRDYYANALLTFEEVKARGWPERKR